MHTVWIVDVLEVSYFKFQLSVTSGTPSKTPLSTISWLDPWRTWLFHLHLWIGFESYHKFAPQMFKIDPLCHQYWCFILCRDTWLINYTDCLRYLYPPRGWVGGWVGLACLRKSFLYWPFLLLSKSLNIFIGYWLLIESRFFLPFQRIET